jgi:hypothetical protein
VRSMTGPEQSRDLACQNNTLRPQRLRLLSRRQLGICCGAAQPCRSLEGRRGSGPFCGVGHQPLPWLVCTRRFSCCQLYKPKPNRRSRGRRTARRPARSGSRCRSGRNHPGGPSRWYPRPFCARGCVRACIRVRAPVSAGACADVSATNCLVLCRRNASGPQAPVARRLCSSIQARQGRARLRLAEAGACRLAWGLSGRHTLLLPGPGRPESPDIRNWELGTKESGIRNQG